MEQFWNIIREWSTLAQFAFLVFLVFVVVHLVEVALHKFCVFIHGWPQNAEKENDEEDDSK